MPYDLDSIRSCYPFDSHYLDIDGHKLHYVDEGSGPPVLMLHGNPTWSFYYRKLILHLRGHYRVIAPDHIGCGLSDKPQRYAYTLATHIQNIERLVDHLALSDVTLAVHDWGGAIGFGWAVRHPDLVRRLVVFNTAAFPGGRIPLRIRICGWPVVGEILVRGLNGFARGALRMALHGPRPLSREEKQGYLLPYGSYANRVAHLRFVRDIPRSERSPSLPVLREMEAGLASLRDRPMIVLWGGRDFCFNDAFLTQWETRFPTAKVHRFADAGHYVVEDAGDEIAPLLDRFLDGAE